MADPLTILRSTHPGLRWRSGCPACEGTDAIGTIILGYTDEDPPEYSFLVAVDGRRYTERGAAPIGVVAAELVDLRRAIGWPVEVSRD